jgi:hypothetical protein
MGLEDSVGPCPILFNGAHSGDCSYGRMMALRTYRALTGPAPMALSRMEHTPGWSAASSEPPMASGEPGSGGDVPSGPTRAIASAPPEYRPWNV